MGNELTELERAVLSLFLDRDEPGFAELRAQAETAKAKERDPTGVGFFTHLETDTGVAAASAPIHSPLDFGRGIAHGYIAGLEHGANFLLWVTDGRLDCIEGYAIADESWPDRVDEFTLEWLPMDPPPK